MCSTNCEHFPASDLRSVVVQVKGGKERKCCRGGAPHNHKGGCVSPDPNEFFPDSMPPNKVTGKKDENEKPKEQCACGKSDKACS